MSIELFYNRVQVGKFLFSNNVPTIIYHKTIIGFVKKENIKDCYNPWYE